MLSKPSRNHVNNIVKSSCDAELKKRTEDLYNHCGEVSVMLGGFQVVMNVKKISLTLNGTITNDWTPVVSTIVLPFRSSG